MIDDLHIASNPPTRRRRSVWRGYGASYLFCAPAAILFTGFVVLPAIIGFCYSLTDWNGWGRPVRFIGLDNFRELLRDEKFLISFRFTLLQTALIVAFFSFGAMVLAVLLDRLRRYKGLIRGMFFYPYILSIVVSALVFQYMGDYRNGLVNEILRRVGLGGWTQEWMGPDWAPLFVFAFLAWSGLGFFTTLYLANLQTIPQDMYEAAAIDGASALRVFTSIQFPMLLPTLTTNSVLALITGINLFPQILVLWSSPRTDVYTVGYYIYKMGIQNNRQGYATAMSLVMFVLLAIVAIVQVHLMRRKEVQL
ncbi:MAG: sugar ABC transporter permease [Candidatus Sumerlaeota bacterium]|nr:sugar ABC transporter permease [Candidatus Sumerlaeota bacterium]